MANTPNIENKSDSQKNGIISFTFQATNAKAGGSTSSSPSSASSTSGNSNNDSGTTILVPGDGTGSGSYNNAATITIPGTAINSASSTSGSAALNPEDTGFTSGCTNISVLGDATYCVSGIVCAGGGDAPVGSQCPRQGDVAVKDCLDILPSWTNNNNCVAPLNAACAKIPSGAWGCVWALNTTSASGSQGEEAGVAGTNSSANRSFATTDSANLSLAASSTNHPSSSRSSGAVMFSGIFGAVVAVLAIIGLVLYRKRNRKPVNAPSPLASTDAYKGMALTPRM